MLLPLQRAGAYGTAPCVVLLHGHRVEASSAVGALPDRDWVVASMTEVEPDAWRVVLLPRD